MASFRGQMREAKAHDLVRMESTILNLVEKMVLMTCASESGVSSMDYR
jgi:hypothetical protein